MAKVLYIWDYKCANFHCLIPIFWFLKNSWPLKFGFWPFPMTLTFSAKSFKIWSFHVIWRKPLHVRTLFAQKKHKSLHPTVYTQLSLLIKHKRDKIIHNTRGAAAAALPVVRYPIMHYKNKNILWGKIEHKVCYFWLFS